MGSEESKPRDETVYFPLTRCHESVNSALCRMDGYCGDFGRCVGTGVRLTTRPGLASIRVDRIARNRAACDSAEQGYTKVEIGGVYSESDLIAFASFAEADQASRDRYGHAPEDTGLADIDKGWVD